MKNEKSQPRPSVVTTTQRLTLPATAPLLTLNVGGTSFRFIPAPGSRYGSIKFESTGGGVPRNDHVHHDDDDDDDVMQIQLDQFTGTLFVATTATTTRKVGVAEQVERPPSERDITPKIAHVSSSRKNSHKKRFGDNDQHHSPEATLPSLACSRTAADPSAPSATKNKNKRLCTRHHHDESKRKEVPSCEEYDSPLADDTNTHNKQPPTDKEEEDDDPVSCSIPTLLLGQPDLSQTQQTDERTENSTTAEQQYQQKQYQQKQQMLVRKPVQQDRTAHDDDAPSRVQQILQQERASLTLSLTASTSKQENDVCNSKSPSSLIIESDETHEKALDQDDDDQKAAVAMAPRTRSLRVAQAANPVPARVSMGTSPVPMNRAKTTSDIWPGPRWGHSCTEIGKERILVYGGQTLDTQTGVPQTLSDIHVYDTSTERWYKPFNCEGMCRQWHTATYLPERQLLISFGGEATNAKTGKTKPVDQTMILDTEIMLWYPPTVSGDIPSNRSGHTATLLPSKNQLVVIGGVNGSKWLRSVSVLDTLRWKWETPKIQGPAPPPRSYHTATSISNNRIVIVGGNNASSSFNTVIVLDCGSGGGGGGDVVWRWIYPPVSGDIPTPRTGHCCLLLDDGKTLCMVGGWDPTADSVHASGHDKKQGDHHEEEEHIFDDMYLLDTDSWVWSRQARDALATRGEGGGGRPTTLQRVGHRAVRHPKNGKIIIFGGRLVGDKFSDDMILLDV